MQRGVYRSMNLDSLVIAEVCRKAARSLGYQEHQVLAVSNLVKGNDVFGVLPTGKSLCYAMFPLMFDQLFATTKTSTDISKQTCLRMSTTWYVVNNDIYNNLCQLSMKTATSCNISLAQLDDARPLSVYVRGVATPD